MYDIIQGLMKVDFVVDDTANLIPAGLPVCGDGG
jgi:hypothetical protein